MNVKIWSHFKDETWEGEVPDPELEHSEAAVLEYLFRFFNRVDEGDAVRLELLGYRLPSLSVDDTVTTGGRTFRVAMMGFDEVFADDTGLGYVHLT